MELFDLLDGADEDAGVVWTDDDGTEIKLTLNESKEKTKVRYVAKSSNVAKQLTSKRNIREISLRNPTQPPASNFYWKSSGVGTTTEDVKPGWVYAANQVIADDCSAVRLKLMRKMPDGDEEEVFSYEILTLLFNPNTIITSKQMWNLYFQYLNLTGEAYIVKLDKDGNPMTDRKKLPSALLLSPEPLM